MEKSSLESDQPIEPLAQGSREGIPLIPPAALGLGVCDLHNIMTPKEIAEMEADLQSLAQMRRSLAEGWDTEIID